MYEYFFVAYFITAFLLWRAADFPGKFWLLFAVISWGVPSLLYSIGLYSDLHQYLNILSPAALLAFVIGIFLLVNQGGMQIGNLEKTMKTGSISNQAMSAVPRNDSNSVSRAEETRDVIYQRFSEALKETNVKGEIFKSPPYSEVIWVIVQIYDPVEGSDYLSYRASVEITVEPLDFRQFDHQLKVVIDTGKKRKTHWPVIDFQKENAIAICRLLAGSIRTLNVPFRKSRITPLQFWRPKNGLAGVKRVHYFPAYVAIAGLVTIQIPVIGGPLLLIGGIWALVDWFDRSRVLSLTTGKPMHEPRILLGMDSWQTVLYELAPHADELKREIAEKLMTGSQNVPERGDRQAATIEVQSERIWHQGVDGKVEREQLVVRLRRAVAFVHVYSYGTDLYVGWDAHLNGGTWIEKGIGKYKELSSGKVANAYKIEPAWQSPGEYDITDANFLLETVHSVVKKVIKQAMADHKIDQDIDFSIVREARKDIAGSDRPGGKNKEVKKSRFQRVA